MRNPTARPKTDDDRREYLRVDDSVILKYKIIPKNEISTFLNKLSSQILDKFSVAASFSAKKQELRPLLTRIQTNSPDVARYLDEIQNQIFQLSQLLMLHEVDNTDEYAQQVSLSAGGVGFFSRQKLPVGSVLEMRILLVASCVGIVNCAEVIRSEPAKQAEGDYPFWTAVEFRQIRGSDRDMLVKHVLGREAAQRQRRTARPVEVRDG